VKLGFNQQKELDALPQTIECLEREQQELFQTMGDPELYKKDRADIVATNDRLEELKRLLAEAYARWEELEQFRLDDENSRLSK
jgi:ATP-binding cassette subfamily F protein uup